MLKRDKIIAAIVAAEIVATFLYFSARHIILTSSVATNSSGETLLVPSDLVVGTSKNFDGDEQSRFTLVEFGDYQCPPCAAAQPKVSMFLAKHKGKVKFQFRNMPLVTMHPDAMPAAVFAERARLRGKFWPVHDALYNQKGLVDVAAVCKIGEKFNVPATAFNVKNPEDKLAFQKIKHDIDEAGLLKIDSTPTFIICLPNGSVVKLGSLDDLENYVK